ncbi:MAG: 50S ribosomal protein L20 [Legionellales bacterium]|nr:50S ribosomal protein L20 [Legionellales bacterium]|tara:strand:- start:13 stop:372 length:360 start_codon:yes stop_codon:yes gene_type:complete
MSRIKRGVTSHKKHKKVLDKAKGYYGARSRTFKVAKQAVIKASQYAYIGRKQRKRQFRSLWIIRINAALQESGLSYSRFIAMLKSRSIELDRKVLSQMALEHPDCFKSLVAHVQGSDAS